MQLWENLFTKLKKIYFYLDAWSGVAVESWSPTTDGGSGADVVAGSWTTDDGSGVDVGTTDGGSESLPLECERVCMGDLKTIMYIVIIILHVYNYLTNQ